MTTSKRSEAQKIMKWTNRQSEQMFRCNTKGKNEKYSKLKEYLGIFFLNTATDKRKKNNVGIDAPVHWKYC